MLAASLIAILALYILLCLLISVWLLLCWHDQSNWIVDCIALVPITIVVFLTLPFVVYSNVKTFREPPVLER